VTIVESDRAVIGGVDTHLDIHVAAALDPIGGLLGVSEFATTAAGYEELFAWLSDFASGASSASGWRAPARMARAWWGRSTSRTSTS
jgi:hypothetical protein